MSDIIGPAAKRRKLNFNEDVKILVGKNEQAFRLHKDALCDRSPFFHAALNGEFREAHEQTVRLPEIEPESFRAYTQWIYSGEIVVVDDKTAAQDPRGDQRRSALMRLYITGDKLSDVVLQNKVIDQIIALNKATRVYFGINAINLAYKNLPECSKLRKLMVDWFKTHRRSDWLRDARTSLPADFFMDLAIAYNTFVNKDGTLRKWDTTSNCTYHDHNAEVPKCSKAE